MYFIQKILHNFREEFGIYAQRSNCIYYMYRDNFIAYLKNLKRHLKIKINNFLYNYGFSCMLILYVIKILCSENRDLKT